MEPWQIIEMAHQMNAAVIAFSFSEPTLAAELTLALAAEARAVGLGIVWKSNGFITACALEQIAPALLAVNVDLKAGDEACRGRPRDATVSVEQQASKS